MRPLPLLLLLKLNLDLAMIVVVAVLAMALAVIHLSMLSSFLFVRTSFSDHSYCYYLYYTIVFHFDYCLIGSLADANHHHLHDVHLASLVLMCSKPFRLVHLIFNFFLGKEIQKGKNENLRIKQLQNNKFDERMGK